MAKTQRNSITRSAERDNYIMAQALFVAIKTLKAVPAPLTELSNIADMEAILNTLFAGWVGVFEVEEKLRAEQAAERAKLAE